ncbi:hypothetical protein DYB37_001938 [Aphanomyces astaci]|uniref:Nucleolar pre-ribosomal-associated protein 1 C-terminal domain-containing protein n=3 Tax=Aphanomyces astaci TaxID=112090 RepID=A0A418EVD2_APHAT|nr:hypothetical protein DYB37_001938 [Aphanomyces astaci]
MVKKRGVVTAQVPSEASSSKKHRGDDGTSSGPSVSPAKKKDAVHAHPIAAAPVAAVVAPSTSVLRDLILNVQRGQLDAVVKTLNEFRTGVLVDETTGEVSSTCPLLQAYLQISPQSEPLVDLWGSALWLEDKSRQIIPVVMELLTFVFQYLRVQSPAVAEAVALHVLKTKMELISKQLSWSDKPHVEHATLALCTSMVTLHPRVAREFVRLFDFTAKAFDKLCVRRSKPFDVVVLSRPSRQINVRHAFVQLILALVTTDDQHIRRFALKGDGIAHALFKSIDDDTYEDVTLILSTLAAAVLASTDVRGKRAVYSSFAISQLVKLIDSSDARIVALGTQTLDALFFHDKALYRVSQAATLAHLEPVTSPDDTSSSSETGAMKVLLKLLASFDLTATMAHPTREALLFRFVSTYPALIVVVFQSFHAVMEPRPSYKWFAAASFVLKALRLPLTALFETSCNDGQYLMEAPLVKLVWPLGMQKKDLSKAVQHTDLLVVHTALNLLLVVLMRAAALMSQGRGNGGGDLSLQHAVRSLVPPPELIVALCTKYRTSTTDPVADKKRATIYGKTLSVLQLYFTHLPQLMTETKFDLSKLVAPNQPLPLRGAVLGLLDVAEPSRLAWIVLGDTSKLKILLQYATAPASAVTPLAVRVVRRVLASLHTFGVAEPQPDVPHEIDLWLRPLVTSPSEAATAFLDVLVRGVAAHPFHFVNDCTSPMTQALVAYFQRDTFPFQIKHVDAPYAVSAYGVQVLAKLAALYPPTWSLPQQWTDDDSGGGTNDRDPLRLVATLATATTNHHQSTTHHKPALPSTKDTIAHLTSPNQPDNNKGVVVVLTEEVLTGVWAATGSFAVIWDYFRAHPTESLFFFQANQTSPCLDAVVRPAASVSPLVRQFVDSSPVDLVLSSLFSPLVLLSPSRTSPVDANHIVSYLQRKACTFLDTVDVQVAILDLVHGLNVYRQRRLNLEAITAEYTATVVVSVTALHFLLLWGAHHGRYPAAFYQVVWRSTVFDDVDSDEVLLRWSVLPYLLSSFVPDATTSAFLTDHPADQASPLSAVLLPRRHLSSAHLLDALAAVLNCPRVNAPLVRHLIRLTSTQTLPRPHLLQKVFAFWQAHDDKDEEAAAPSVVKSWMLHYVLHHPLNKCAVAVPLFDACWARLQTCHHSLLNLRILEALIQRSPACRAEFTRVPDPPPRRVSTSVAGLTRLCAAYLSSLPLVPSCVSWIEAVVLPAFVDEVLDAPDTLHTCSIPALADAYATLYSSSDNAKEMAHLEWLSDVLATKKHAVPKSTLQLLLLTAQYSDLSKQASKCVSFGLAQLTLHAKHHEDATVVDAIATFTRHVVTRYGLPKRMPESAIQSFVTNLSPNWVACESLLELVAALVPLYPSLLDVASLLDQLVDAFDASFASNAAEMFVKTLGVVILACNHPPIPSSVVSEAFLRHVLAAYGATLSPLDLLLKAVVDAIVVVAGEGHVTLERVGYCFGSKANHVATGDLDQHWLLDEIDADMMKTSIAHFPIDRPFHGSAYVPASSSHDLYDPAYMLPLIAHTISSSAIPDRHLLSSGILGYAICGLSADDATLRAHAYGIVATAHESMSATARTFDFSERRQVFLLLETLKNGIAEPHARLPCLLSVFVNDAIAALLKPGHFMFPLVNAFLLSRSALDVNDVPMFYALFNSSSTMFRAERSWLLHLVRVKLDVDVELLQRRHVFSILLGFFDSPLADAHTQGLVLEILATAVATAAGNVILVHKMGLLAWLQAVAIKHEGKFTALLLSLVHTSIQSYYLSEKPTDRYAANIMSQLHQLCRTLVVQHQQCLKPTDVRDVDFALLPAVLTQFFTFCTLAKAPPSTSVWFSLDLLDSTTALLPRDSPFALALLPHVVWYLQRIPAAPRDFQFSRQTFGRWTGVVSWAVAQAATSRNLPLQLALPDAVHALTQAVRGFHVDVV